MSLTASTPNELLDKLIPIASQFRLAEKAIKSAEQCETNISLTAINQSKNAFNHLCIAIEYYKAGDFTNADENFRKAIGHCKRAYYDACDAEITFCLAQINLFISHCRTNRIPLHSIIPEYADISSLIVEAKHFLETDQLEISDKDTRYEKAKEYRDSIKSKIHDKLHGYYEVANEEIDLINKLQQEKAIKDDESRKSLFWARFSGIIAVLAIIVAVVLVVFEPDLKMDKKYFGKSENKQDILLPQQDSGQK